MEKTNYNLHIYGTRLPNLSQRTTSMHKYVFHLVEVPKAGRNRVLRHTLNTYVYSLVRQITNEVFNSNLGHDELRQIKVIYESPNKDDNRDYSFNDTVCSYIERKIQENLSKEEFNLENIKPFQINGHNGHNGHKIDVSGINKNYREFAKIRSRYYKDKR